MTSARTHRNVTRRKAMRIGAGALGSVLAAGMLQAGEGGGGGPLNDTQDTNSGTRQRSNTRRRRKSRDRQSMSQRHLTRLSQREVDRLISLPTERRPELDGFSDVMRDWILDGMQWERRRMQRLVRDMQGITDPKERRDRLRREIRQSKENERLFQSSIDRLSAIENRNAGQNRALSEERSRLFSAQQFRAAVEVWERYSHEGTR